MTQAHDGWCHDDTRGGIMVTHGWCHDDTRGGIMVTHNYITNYIKDTINKHVKNIINCDHITTTSQLY